MFQARILLLLSAGLLVRVSTGTPNAARLFTEALQEDTGLDKDWTGSLLLRLISDLAERDEALPELGVGVALMRRHLPLSQRERKAGCRNFFWKTFTSC
ncbi:somatostatin-1 [Corythoichthys intestinalis]|uniref:somatostatin-1 n=1 Tax=Corythoichthys intestinalis TaxID=161448 RepID=UPI0025A61A97|nr:somatostatin-1 [Corythoichthys intestinalis]XP_061810621.1 somatostatin-1-like [Nerophis lumbriciformis]